MRNSGNRRPLSVRMLVMVALAAAWSCGGAGSNTTAPTSNGTTTTTTTGSTTGSTTGTTTTSTSNSVSVGDNSFTPSAITVSVGTTVTWTWVGYATHNVTFDDGDSSPDQTAGGTYSLAFSTAGTYKYHCTIHGAAMSGTVTVQ